MELDGIQLRLLHKAILSAFPSRTDLALLVRFGLNHRLDEITDSQNLAASAFALLEWAEARGIIWDLIEAALAENPNNRDLRSVAAQLSNHLQKQPNSPETSIYGLGAEAGTSRKPADDNVIFSAVGRRPGGAMSARPLHLVWILDNSGYMLSDGKMQTLNTAIHEVIPPLREAAAENPHAQILVRAIKFSRGADWHLAKPTPIEELIWHDLQAVPVSYRDLGAALWLVASELKMPPMSNRALPPILVLVTDGRPTDDPIGGLKHLLSHPWGRKAVRLAISIGSDVDQDVLQQFIANPELRPLPAYAAEDLVRYIRWISTAIIQAASSPSNGFPIPLPGDLEDDGDDVW